MSNCPIVPVICARRRYRYIFEHSRIPYLALFVIQSHSQSGRVLLLTLISTWLPKWYKRAEGAREEGSLQVSYATLVFLSLAPIIALSNDASDCPPLFSGSARLTGRFIGKVIIGIKLYLLFFFFSKHVLA